MANFTGLTDEEIGPEAAAIRKAHEEYRAAMRQTNSSSAPYLTRELNMPPSDIPAIPYNLSRLEKAIHELAEGIAALDDRLGPVMLKIPSANAVPKEDRPALCFMAENLANATNQIEGLQRRVHEIFDALQL